MILNWILYFGSLLGWLAGATFTLKDEALSLISKQKLKQRDQNRFQCRIEDVGRHFQCLVLTMLAYAITSFLATFHWGFSILGGAPLLYPFPFQNSPSFLSRNRLHFLIVIFTLIGHFVRVFFGQVYHSVYDLSALNLMCCLIHRDFSAQMQKKLR